MIYRSSMVVCNNIQILLGLALVVIFLLPALSTPIYAISSTTTTSPFTSSTIVQGHSNSFNPPNVSTPNGILSSLSNAIGNSISILIETKDKYDAAKSILKGLQGGETTSTPITIPNLPKPANNNPLSNNPTPEISSCIPPCTIPESRGNNPEPNPGSENSRTESSTVISEQDMRPPSIPQVTAPSIPQVTAPSIPQVTAPSIPQVTAPPQTVNHPIFVMPSHVSVQSGGSSWHYFQNTAHSFLGFKSFH